jgi:hypothetical protein
MVAGCGNGCVKFILFTTNFAISVCFNSLLHKHTHKILQLCGIVILGLSLAINLSGAILNDIQKAADSSKIDVDLAGVCYLLFIYLFIYYA